MSSPRGGRKTAAHGGSRGEIGPHPIRVPSGAKGISGVSRLRLRIGNCFLVEQGVALGDDSRVGDAVESEPIPAVGGHACAL